MARPLALKVGTEVVELDAETVARIEALRDTVNDGQLDGTLLRRMLDAGIKRALERAPASGEDSRELADHDSGEEPIPAGDETECGGPIKPTWH